MANDRHSRYSDSGNSSHSWVSHRIDYMNNSKICYKCKNFLSLTDFSKNKLKKDGHQAFCKQCQKSYLSVYRIVNFAKIQITKKDWAIKRTSEQRIRDYGYVKNWLEADFRRKPAHNKLKNAVKSGEIVRQPCLICGSEKSMAHHESYDRPLDVIWFCQLHHKARHKEMNFLGIKA